MIYTWKSFADWNTNAAGTGTPYTAGASLAVTDDVSLYAQWSTIQYTITYNANGAAATPPASQTVDAGTSIVVADKGGLTYTGYTFSGWNTIAAGTGTAYIAGASLSPDANMTLYAQWTPITSASIHVGFNYGEIIITGSDGINAVSQSGAKGPLSLLLSASGYSNVSWYVDGDITNRITDSGVGIILNAADYTVQIHSITFVGMRSGVLYSQEIPFTVFD
jgi:uncharacterized repeat protein (TIGR02543 family)